MINTAFLGDLVLTIPFLTRLKEKFPQAKIALVCKKGIGDLFLKLGLVDETFEVQKGSGSAYSKIAHELNREKIDYVFCIHRSLRSYIFSLNLNAEFRVGFKTGFNLFGYTYRTKRDLKLPEAIRILQLLALVDTTFGSFFQREAFAANFNLKSKDQSMVKVPEWAAFPKAIEPSGVLNPLVVEALHRTEDSKKRIAVFPGSVWNTKRWPVEHFSHLVKDLMERGYAVFLMGGPGEEVYGDFIEKKVGTSTLVNLVGKTSVWESMLTLSQCDLVVANDSASAHLAALLEKKTLVFFGPTVLSFGYRPWGDNVTVMENIKITCRPCGAHGPQVCPIKTHVCMTSITADSALKQIETIL